MEQDNEIFIRLDVLKARYTVALAEDRRSGEGRYLGEIDNDPVAVRRMVARFAKRHGQLHFCDEAGPTGYGLYRQLVALGRKCIVVAPSLIPKRPGDRVKTNRRDAMQLTRSNVNLRGRGSPDALQASARSRLNWAYQDWLASYTNNRPRPCFISIRLATQSLTRIHRFCATELLGAWRSA